MRDIAVGEPVFLTKNGRGRCAIGDTQAAIAGAIAEGYYGIPKEIKTEAYKRFSQKINEYYRYSKVENYLKQVLG